MPLISQSVGDTFFPKPTDRTPNCSLSLSFRTLFPMLRVRVLRVLYSPARTFTFNYQTTVDNIVCMYIKRTNLHAAFTTGSRVWTPLKDLIFALVSFSPFSCWTIVLKRQIPSGFNACTKNLETTIGSENSKCAVAQSLELQTKPFPSTAKTA